MCDLLDGVEGSDHCGCLWTRVLCKSLSNLLVLFGVRYEKGGADSQFECIGVWANQSRKCPLCSAEMAPFLLHDLDSSVPTKVRPSSHLLQYTAGNKLEAKPSSTSHHYPSSNYPLPRKLVHQGRRLEDGRNTVKIWTNWTIKSKGEWRYTRMSCLSKSVPSPPGRELG